MIKVKKPFYKIYLNIFIYNKLIKKIIKILLF